MTPTKSSLPRHFFTHDEEEESLSKPLPAPREPSIPTPPALVQDDEGNIVGRLPVEFAPLLYNEVPLDITEKSTPTEVLASDLTHINAILKNIRSVWDRAVTLQDVKELSALTINTLKSRRDALLMPTEYQRSVGQGSGNLLLPYNEEEDK